MSQQVPRTHSNYHIPTSNTNYSGQGAGIGPWSTYDSTISGLFASTGLRAHGESAIDSTQVGNDVDGSSTTTVYHYWNNDLPAPVHLDFGGDPYNALKDGIFHTDDVAHEEPRTGTGSRISTGYHSHDDDEDLWRIAGGAIHEWNIINNTSTACGLYCWEDFPLLEEWPTVGSPK